MKPAETATRFDLGALSSHVSREIVRLHASIFGRGPTKAKTHLTDDYLLCVLEEIFTQAERTLIESGKGDQVKTNRHAFHDVIEPRATAIVEAATGRRVRAFTSAVHVDADAAFDLFLFEDRASAQPE